jgi:hypothetical protein
VNVPSPAELHLLEYWPAFAGLVLGTGGVLGWYNARQSAKKVPAEIGLLNAQTEESLATAAKTRADADTVRVDNIDRALAKILLQSDEIERLKAERNLLEFELERCNAEKKLNHITK